MSSITIPKITPTPKKILIPKITPIPDDSELLDFDESEVNSDVDDSELLNYNDDEDVETMNVDKREPCAEDATNIIIRKKQERVLELINVIKTKSEDKLLSKSEVMSFANYNNIFIDEKLINNTYTPEQIFDIYNKLCQRYKDEISDVYI